MEIVPGLAGLPARLKWLRQTYLGLRSPRQMSKAMSQHYRSSKRKGLSHVTIWRYEEGERTPTAVELYNIAEFANVSPAWLLTGEGAAPSRMRSSSRS
jgi:transcriptional regulator with XRE-family HTH domain